MRTQEDLDKLDSAIGVLQSMKLGDQEFVFRPLDELMKLRSLIQQEINATSGTAGATRYAATSKGV